MIAGSKADTSVVVPATSFDLQTEVEPAFAKAAKQQKAQLKVQESHPLPSSDPVDVVSGLLLVLVT